MLRRIARMIKSIKSGNETCLTELRGTDQSPSPADASLSSD
jgi:hypothetical protein